MNQTYIDHEGVGVAGILCLLICVRTLPLLRSSHNSPPSSKKEIDGNKVPSKYTTDFLWVLYDKEQAGC
jgi:hypothetical protein